MFLSILKNVETKNNSVYYISLLTFNFKYTRIIYNDIKGLSIRLAYLYDLLLHQLNLIIILRIRLLYEIYKVLHYETE